MIRLHKRGDFWFAKDEHTNLWFALPGAHATRARWVYNTQTAAGYYERSDLIWALKQSNLTAVAWLDADLREHPL